MTIWHELQEQGLILHGCILADGKIVQSSFSQEYKKNLAVVRQALLFVFKNMAKIPGYDEAHIEVGDHHYSGYQLDSGIVVVCFCDSDAKQPSLREFIDQNRQSFLDLAA